VLVTEQLTETVLGDGSSATYNGRGGGRKRILRDETRIDEKHSLIHCFQQHLGFLTAAAAWAASASTAGMVKTPEMEKRATVARENCIPVKI
jgi:hypothetical protein